MGNTSKAGLEKELQSLRKKCNELERSETIQHLLNDKLSARNRELELINQANIFINSSLDLDKVLSTVLDQIRTLFGVVGSSIWLRVDTSGAMVCQQAAGLQCRLVKGWKLAPGEGIAGWVSAHGKSVIISDTRKDLRHFKGVSDKMNIELRSILSVPIKTKGDVIGALQVVDKKSARFNEAHQSLLEELAATSSTAIENARLYERANREIQERKKAQKKLKAREKELKEKTSAIKEVNTALNVLLKNRKLDQISQEEKIMTNLKDLVAPYIDKLESSKLSPRQVTYVEIIKANIKNVVSPFLRQLPLKFFDFTPAEIQVADLVKKGKTTKQISEIINSSPKTVEAHRNRLRKKLGLTNQKIKLRDFLVSQV